jgi:hypothetical protein
MADDELFADDVSRRDVLKRVGIATGIVWATPVLTTLNVPAAAAAAGTPQPHPECAGASCQTFIPCSSSNPDCVCVTSAGGAGFCVPGSTPCAAGPPCDTNLGCPSGFTCFVETCCGEPVCGPNNLVDQCPPDTSAYARRAPRKSSGPGTYGG